MDGFTIRRKGDATTKMRIMLYLEQQPEQYKLHADLGRFLTGYMRTVGQTNAFVPP